MKIEELDFPVTPEAFISYQEELTGRELPEGVREAVEAWLPNINTAYEDGRHIDGAALLEDLTVMDGLIAHHGECTTLSRFLKTTQLWIAYAWKRGRHDADSGAVAV